MFRSLYLLCMATAMTLLPSSASPQTSPKRAEPKPAAREDAVIACVRHVRKTISQSRFDAYVTTRGAVQFSGDAHERTVFKDCLRERGYGPEPEKRPGD